MLTGKAHHARKQDGALRMWPHSFQRINGALEIQLPEG